MSKDFRSIDYSVNDVGKIMKASKKRHMWVFVYKSKRFTLCVFESLKSGKFKIELNKKSIYETVGGKRSISKKVHDSRAGPLTIELMKITNNKYRLTVNKNTFETKNANEQLFVYETFEQKKKQIENQSKNKESEEFFGFGKGGGSKGLKGSDLFGDFKKNSKTSGKMKLNFGGKTQKKDMFKFDKGVFDKKGKFGENDFFGAKNNKKKPAKKGIFGDDDDIFGKKIPQKKKASDFDGFDLFGNQKSNKPQKKKQTNFDDFGFGNVNSNKQSNYKRNQQNSKWSKNDIFGKPNKPSRSAQDEIFGAPARAPVPKKNADDDLLNFDIGTPSNPPPKNNPSDFGDLNWDMPVKPKKSLKKVWGNYVNGFFKCACFISLL
jgi:hypothetical protein